jgi:hypothetical protein
MFDTFESFSHTIEPARRRGRFSMTGRILATYEKKMSEERPQTFLIQTHWDRSKTIHNFQNRQWQHPLISPEI